MLVCDSMLQLLLLYRAKLHVEPLHRGDRPSKEESRCYTLAVIADNLYGLLL